MSKKAIKERSHETSLTFDASQSAGYEAQFPTSTAPTHKSSKTAVPLNPTGMHPVEFKVLVRLDPTEGVSAGGVHIPDMRQERDQAAQTYATLIETGGNAFENWEAPLPTPGDRILIDKYSGAPPRAGDYTDLYRLCNDKDIVAILR